VKAGEGLHLHLNPVVVQEEPALAAVRARCCTWRGSGLVDECCAAADEEVESGVRTVGPQER
jgi:hypothetical protein